jgi:hypothetical protein
MHGLTVRWSLAAAPADVDEQLASYVADSSFERFSGKEGLRFKTWRTRPGQWFEGCYVFASDEARTEFQRVFSDGADTSPVSQIVGSAPELIEEYEVVAVAEGGDGFLAAPRY